MKFFLQIALSFLAGAALLIALSFFQKLMAGFNPYKLMGYIIPLVFGGTVGSILGAYIYKVKSLNRQLKERIGTLESILPICSNCNKIRKPDSDPKDIDSWERIESYISHKTSSQFSHGICPDCMTELYGDVLNKNK